MSTHSSSTSSNTTGPSRFRSDAASFLPSQHPSSYHHQQQQQPALPPQQQQHTQPHHTQPNQYYTPQPHMQQHIQPHPQQHMYMQYANTQYPMMMSYNPMYVPVYVDNPYYPTQQYGIPVQPQPIPFTQPNPYNNQRKSINNTYNKRPSQTHMKYTPANAKPNGNIIKPTNIEYSSSSSPIPKKDELSTPTSTSCTTSTLSTPATTPAKTIATTTNDHHETNDSNEQQKQQQQQPPQIQIKYPIFINTDLNAFINQFDVTHRFHDHDKKNRILNNLQTTATNRLIFNTPLIKAFDFNSNSTTTTDGGVRQLLKTITPSTPEPTESVTSHASTIATPASKTATPSIIQHEKQPDQKEETKEQQQLSPQPQKQQQPQPANWASFLQTSARSTPDIAKPAKPTKMASPATPLKSTTPIPTSTASSSVTDFNMNNESAQPLGVLLLRVMFDPNYSVLNSELPIYSIKPRGLINTGNICYMNSILQILLHCEPFNRLLKLIENKSIGSLGGNSTTPLLDATIKFFNEFTNSNENLVPEGVVTSKLPAISPKDFYDKLVSQPKFSHLQWGQQEDAEEFLGYYLDGLNEEFLESIKRLTTPMVDSLIQSYSIDNIAELTNKFKYNVKITMKKVKNDLKDDENQVDGGTGDGEWNEVGANKKIHVKRTVEVDPTPINMIFGGQFKSVLTIPKSSSNQYQKSITLDPFQHVQLDISKSDTIEEAFKHLNELEQISYKSNNNKEVQIKKQTFIDKLPEILIIHLKRFSYTKDQDIQIEKLRKKIDYNHDLIIPKDILSSHNEIEEFKYRLIAVVYHHGSSADAGHYTSDIYKGNEEWWRIDDTLLKKITNEEVLNAGTEENIKNAYILLYQKIQN
ncbi:uncharacterized protein J8A68_004023 [[Candida] subhashii]|uniref:Ubiquitin carboxyl-terminal hydrolase n=1 Tax=[Candida] subhashii TaxID=561895 RepID=A0A8J5UL41_9ASCO|nr:uncharacterized protein J8A68_004023 [[Candida] subhashii]KAG7662492.1 hypothetical protein J8A68_004023 [[Candida] subhashii]